MEIKQINLKISENLHLAIESYAKNFGFRKIQELIAESVHEKVFEKNSYDELFSEDEVDLIDSLIKVSIEKEKLVSEEELNKILHK